jgi:glycosyltransferase involved in cell wall biosynthesis
MIPRKSGEPTVCFLGRFDGEKRPELFLELAERFPGVRFVAMGRANDESMDRALRRRYGGSTNVEMPGFISGDAKRHVLDEAWILVNTSVSEGFPVSFLEAAAHTIPRASPAASGTM